MITNSDDVIDVRSLVEYVEEQQGEVATLRGEWEDEEDPFRKNQHRMDLESLEEELAPYKELLEEIGGYGDMTIRGVTYPDTLIHRNHWPAYVKQEAEDRGYDPDADWPAKLH